MSSAYSLSPTSVGLPKWPQMLVHGRRVPRDAAMEIIRRTDRFFQSGYGGNDRRFDDRIRELVRMPRMDRCFEPGEVISAEDSWGRWRESWGVIDTEYVHNEWVSCAFIGGPHGWCHPDGRIHYSDNVGKWPSVESVAADWTVLAKNFPFLDLDALLMSGEQCEETVEPLVGFQVREGRVTTLLPCDYSFFSRFGESAESVAEQATDPIAVFMSRLAPGGGMLGASEHGVTLHEVAAWAYGRGVVS